MVFLVKKHLSKGCSNTTILHSKIRLKLKIERYTESTDKIPLGEKNYNLKYGRIDVNCRKLCLSSVTKLQYCNHNVFQTSVSSETATWFYKINTMMQNVKRTLVQHHKNWYGWIYWFFIFIKKWYSLFPIKRSCGSFNSSLTSSFPWTNCTNQIW